jgi:hypothetical protein
MTESETDLRQRVQTALARAAAIGRRSRRLVDEAQEWREHKYVLCCAWCGRHLVDGEYVDPPSLRPFNVSHGICPACLADLRRSGRSH